MSMALLTSSAARFLFLCLLNSAFATGTEMQLASVTAKWGADLRSAVGSTPLPYEYSGHYEIKDAPVTSLWFTDNDTIVATFVTHKDEAGNPKLYGREGKSLPLRLRAVFLDSASGKITATREWPSESRHAGIVATLGGKFVTQTGNELMLYSSDLEKLKTLSLPPSPSQFEWYAIPSSTGKNILLTIGHEEWMSSWKWVETDNLELAHSWEAQPVGTVSITDDKIALSTLCADFGCEQPPKLEIRGLATDWSIIGPGRNGYIFFVNEDELFLPGDPRPDVKPSIPARLIRTNGQTIFTETELSGGSEWWNPPVRSSEGKRFVAPGLHFEGAHAALDIRVDIRY